MVFIGFLSDFGLEDEWVASCKGVIYRIAPDSKIIDISHQIPPFDIRKGALVLASSLPYFPIGIHVAVVDPGVGGFRKPLALKVGRGDILIGPDNGLLIPAAEKLGGIVAGFEIKNPRYMLDEVSPTFHGRDIFAPTAAHLLKGADIGDVGPLLDTATLAKIPWPEPVIERDRIACRVIDIDRFGTLKLNIDASKLKELDVFTGRSLPVDISGNKYIMPFVKVFEDVSEGELLLAVDASNRLSIAQNMGNAARRLKTNVDDEVVIEI